MRVLITGGAGFIGSWVGEILELEGHVVLAVDDLSGGYRSNLEGRKLAMVDITDRRATDDVVRVFRPDVVIHAAAYAAEGLSHWMREYNYTQNLIGWSNLANAVVRHHVPRVVALSSIAVYGSQEPPFTEAMPVMPEDPYGISKAAMEADLKSLGDVFGTEWLIVRPHNVMGPRQNLADPYRNVVTIFIRQAMAGDPLTVFGDGMQTRAFSYIEDVANAIAELSVSSFNRRIVNIGGEEPITVLRLAQLVLAATGSSSKIEHLPARYEVRDAYSDHAVLRDLLGGWSPTDIAWGVAQTAEWAKTIDVGRLRRYEYELRDQLPAVWA